MRQITIFNIYTCKILRDDGLYRRYKPIIYIFDFMKIFKPFVIITGALFLSATLQSCLDDDDSYEVVRPTALVTVTPYDDGSFMMYLDEKTGLYPSNMTKSPFGNKEVRALVNYDEVDTYSGMKRVHINWIDSIRTKKPILAAADNEEIGNDPIEIVKDWVTIGEDGYLTLRLRTLWGYSNIKHEINLLSDVNPENPLEFELRHNAHGDAAIRRGDALIAFNLKEFGNSGDDVLKIKLNWTSFTGKKSAEFEVGMRNEIYTKPQYNKDGDLSVNIQ